MGNQKKADTATDIAAVLNTQMHEKTAQVGIIGLGYVGLPLALAFARKGFRTTGFDVDQVILARNVDMRFGMQVHELDVAVPMGPLDQRTVQGLLNDFVAKYESIYGPNSAYLGAGMEFVTFRVIGTVKMERPVLDAPNVKETASSLIDRRRAYFAPHGLVDTEFHAGDRLKIGQTLQGPCIIQRAGDTVVLPPKTSALIDRCGGIVITLQ